MFHCRRPLFVRTTKWNWNETVLKQFWNCFAGLLRRRQSPSRRRQIWCCQCAHRVDIRSHHCHHHYYCSNAFIAICNNWWHRVQKNSQCIKRIYGLVNCLKIPETHKTYKTYNWNIFWNKIHTLGIWPNCDKQWAPYSHALCNKNQIHGHPP